MPNERCDGCSARAGATATKDDKHLFFCIHHMNRMKSNLEAQGWQVTIHIPVPD